ncbi:hypothetical protein AVEN_165525-1 [Araneus ventricosus]|uniref:Uncharacterized protein n=1 Tax=Araneus ventricosus TaxID=182803 RepID=A0A4Y2RK21_ARAVE|nr:hypothetical protein AVEN_165525-1 [Araneus ventricosus]
MAVTNSALHLSKGTFSPNDKTLCFNSSMALALGVPQCIFLATCVLGSGGGEFKRRPSGMTAQSGRALSASATFFDRSLLANWEVGHHFSWKFLAASHDLILAYPRRVSRPVEDQRGRAAHQHGGGDLLQGLESWYHIQVSSSSSEHGSNDEVVPI